MLPLRTCALGVAILLFAGGVGAYGQVSTIPADSDARGGLEAALLDGDNEEPLQLDSLELRAEKLRVKVMTWKGKAARNPLHPDLEPMVQTELIRNETYEIHGVVVTSAATQQIGHVGIHPGAYREAVFVADRDVGVLAQDWTYLSTEKKHFREEYKPARAAMGPWWTKVYDHSKEHQMDYFRSVPTPSLLVTSPGSFAYSGSGIVHVYGVDLMLHARENTTSLETGQFIGTSDLANDVLDRWVLFEAENMTLVTSARDPWTMSFSGLRVQDSIITPTGARRAAALAPPVGPGGDGAEATVRTGVSLLALLGALTVMTGVLVLPRLPRRHPPAAMDPAESWEPEDCMSRAAVHIEAARFDRALEWVTQARRLAPTSARVRGTEAFVLGQLGRTEEALAAYAEASRLAPGEGEHDFLAARLALRAERPLEEVESLLVRALERSPDLAPELDEDPALQALAERPRVAEALDRAWDAYTRTLGSREGDERE